MPVEAQDAMGFDSESFLRNFTKPFPMLLIHVYNFVKNYGGLSQEPVFVKYFS